jgi:CubicO group peptidase (beta-lactamase class C family)
MRDIRFKKAVWFSLFTIMFSIFIGNVAYGKNTSVFKEDDFSTLEKYIQSEMKSSYIPGTAVGIIKDNNVVYSKGFGIADSKGKKVTTETSFNIGSISKTFATVATMQLVEKGKINLNAPIEEYIPWVKITIPVGAPKITIKHLLSHTSGLTTNLGQKGVTEDKSENIKELILKQKDLTTNRSAGESWEYSNLNFILIGAIIESVSGESYSDYLRKNILTPLEMNNTYLAKEEILNGNSAKGFQTFFGKLISFDYPYREDRLSAGMVYSNIEDMTHYMSMLLNEGKYKDKTILSPESIKNIRSPRTATSHFSFGLGVFVDRGIYYHGGDDFNFHAYMVLNPYNKDGAILMYNTNHYLIMQYLSLHNKLFNEQLTTPSNHMDQAITSTIIGKKSYNFRSVNIDKMYLVLDTMFVIIILLLSISIYRLRCWRQRMLDKSKFKIINIIWAILINGILPLFILNVPRINGATWISTYQGIPDLGYGLMAIAFVLLVIGFIKTCMLLSILKFKKLKIDNKCNDV